VTAQLWSLGYEIENWKRKPKNGGCYVDNFTDSTCSAVAWRVAHLAVQQVVGLLPERRARSGGCDPSGLSAGGAALGFAGNEIGGEGSMSSPLFSN
jgi:hypothetical protein